MGTARSQLYAGGLGMTSSRRTNEPSGLEVKGSTAGATLRRDHEKAIASFLEELVEVVESHGRHEGHTLEQVGRCVYCSCGFRYQGRKP